MSLSLPARFAFVLASLPLTAHALTPSQVFDQVKDSVVIIKTLDAKGKEKSQGSGVLLSSGKIATNCHVVKDGASFEAGRGKSFVPATSRQAGRHARENRQSRQPQNRRSGICRRRATGAGTVAVRRHRFATARQPHSADPDHGRHFAWFQRRRAVRQRS